MKIKKLTAKPFDQTFPANVAAYSKSGNLLAVGGGTLYEPGVVSIWDCLSHSTIACLTSHSTSVYRATGALAFSPDGRMLAVCSAVDNCIELWDADSWEHIGLLTLIEPPYIRGPAGHQITEVQVKSLVFSWDSRYLAAACSDETVKLWEVNSALRTLLHDGNRAGCNFVCFSDDDTMIVSGTHRSVTVWTGGEIIRTIRMPRGETWSHCTLGSGPLVFSVGHLGTLIVSNTQTGDQTEYVLPEKHDVAIVAGCSRANLIAIGYTNNRVSFWSRDENAVVGTMRCKSTILDISLSEAYPHMCMITGSGANRAAEYSYE